MSGPTVIVLTGALVAASCSLVGCFLVLRRMALMGDAISHAVLLGIVLAFFVTGDLSSPFLLAGAAATGLLTVLLIELVKATGLVREDAAIGLVFPALFSVAVILVARFADSVHLDTDVVLLGELAFAPFDRFVAFGWDWGPKALVEIGAVLLLNVVLIALFYKELKLATFDPALALALGFSPVVVHYGLMALVSVTAVAAFDAVGSILVVALMVAPPATAYLLTDRLGTMLALSAVTGAVAGDAGYWLAHVLDVSIAGAIASVAGLLFAAAFLLAPQRGLVAVMRRRRRQRWEFAEAMLAIHLLHHEGRAEAARENRLEHLGDHLRWEPDFASRVVRRAERRGVVVAEDGSLGLTDQGRAAARAAIAG